MTHRVSVSKDYLTFSAAHFLAIPGHRCEALHGHNYVVTVAVEGPVDPATGFVIDFAVLKRRLRSTLDAIDHRVMIAGNNPRVTVRTEGGRTTVEYGGGMRFLFPASDVAVVPVPETTAELLAEYLANEVMAGLLSEGMLGLGSVTVDVEESPGQVGSFTAAAGTHSRSRG